MLEDRRAHERLDYLEDAIKKHISDHLRFETSLTENTALTKTIADNTAELVMLVKGAKGLRTFAVWVTPLVVAVIAIWAWIKAH